MAGLTYNTFVSSLANMLVVPVDDPAFVLVIPNVIDYAEQRIYRDLDLLQTIVRDSSAALTSGNRNFTLPTDVGTFIVLDDINVITPAGTVDPELGTRVSLLPTSKESLDALYPSSTGSGVPSYFAMIQQSSIIVGPWPDQAYQIEVVGTQRPAPMSVTNQTTFLSVNLPDLLLAAACLWGAAFQKNFSEVGDQPQAAAAFEAQYNILLKSSNMEEMRKRFTAAGWSSRSPSPDATPPRT